MCMVSTRPRGLQRGGTRWSAHKNGFFLNGFFLSGPSCAASLWAALGRAVGAHRSVSTVSGRPRAACRAWHVELAERQAALASLLSQRPCHPTDRPARARPPPAFPPLQSDVGVQNGRHSSLPRGCSTPRCRRCWHWTRAPCYRTYKPAHWTANCGCCADLMGLAVCRVAERCCGCCAVQFSGA